MQKQFMQAKLAIAQLEHDLKFYLNEINKQNDLLIKENSDLKNQIEEYKKEIEKLTENDKTESPSE